MQNNRCSYFFKCLFEKKTGKKARNQQIVARQENRIALQRAYKKP